MEKQDSSLRAIKCLNCFTLCEELVLGLTLLDSIVFSQSQNHLSAKLLVSLFWGGRGVTARLTGVMENRGKAATLLHS